MTLGSKGYRNPEVRNILGSRWLVSVSVCDVMSRMDNDSVNGSDVVIEVRNPYGLTYTVHVDGILLSHTHLNGCGLLRGIISIVI